MALNGPSFRQFEPMISVLSFCGQQRFPTVRTGFLPSIFLTTYSIRFSTVDWLLLWQFSADRMDRISAKDRVPFSFFLFFLFVNAFLFFHRLVHVSRKNPLNHKRRHWSIVAVAAVRCICVPSAPHSRGSDSIDWLIAIRSHLQILSHYFPSDLFDFRNRFHWVSLGFTRFYWVLPGFT